MDLKVCVKCILSFIFCFWRSESVNSMECEIGGSLLKPDINLHCSLQTGFRGTLKENCQFFSCKQNETVDWKIINARKGDLQVKLQDLPKFCNFESYDIDLEVYDENENYNETLMCDTGNSPWRTHSRRTLETLCSNCSLRSSEDCALVHIAVFNFVYPGLYRIKITPYVSGNTRQAQRSYRMRINSTVTYYVKKKFTDLNLNASVQYRSTQRELDLGIPLLIEDTPHAVKVDVKFSNNHIHLYGIKYGNKNSSSIKCEEIQNLPLPLCKVQNADLECKFFNMSQGFYSIHVHFNDDRCKKGTVWANQYSDPCYWIIRKNFTADGGAIDAAVIPINESLSPEVLYIIILIVILIGVIIASFVAKKISLRRQRLGNGIIGKASENVRKPDAEQTYNFNDGNATGFNFGNLLTLPERPRPEVLLVYTRETPPFMDLVACLRKVLDKICKCKVYDYFESDFWNDVCGDPQGWVYTLIVERQAKVIIIASEVAAIRHGSLMGESPTLYYEFPHPFDHLFLYALRLLRDGMNEDSYRKHFVVTFDGFTESNHLLDYFNPYTRFVLPKHLNRLFEHMHDPDTTMHFDANRLEERDEVRELRLQLEHLKNVKLLAKSENSHKLYGW